MKRVLVISPYFPPVNTPDMQRARMSLPYFKSFGWEAEVVTIDERYADAAKDELLLQSIPPDVKIHKVKAFNKRYTAKFGLGSIALRSLWFYKKKVDELLKSGSYHLIYFSTTQFPVCILGPRWKKKFNIPYVIDMQDPWHSDYYRDKPRHQRPPKYWLSYRLNKYMEPLAMKHTDGLISVSAHYINQLKSRYKELIDVPSATITFGAFADDLTIATANQQQFNPLLTPGHINIVYVGRGGHDMHKATGLLFSAMQSGLNSFPELFKKLRFYFIGTSYAPAGKGTKTIMPLAETYGITDYVVEITDRISHYHTLLTLQQANALFIPGSDDPKYTASKIYPYLLTQKPLLAIFNKASNAHTALNASAENAAVLSFDEKAEELISRITALLKQWASGKLAPVHLLQGFESYSAERLTFQQTELFNKALTYFYSKR